MIPVLVAGGARTPFGRFGGELRDQTVSSLTLPAVRAALERSAVDAEQVDTLVFGNVLPVTSDAPFASRAVAVEAGMATTSTALNVNRACGTGVQALVSAAQTIASGHCQIALAAGAEVFSNAPLAVHSRWGHKRGVPAAEDTLDWVYRDPFGNLMGETAQALALYSDISRERQDEYALLSQQRAAAARQAGVLAHEIVPAGGLEVDETPRPQTTLEQLAALPPSFGGSDGTVTAGNSTGINDGAAAVVLIGEPEAARRELAVRARVVDWAVAGVEPSLMGRGPVPATRELMRRTGVSVEDIDVCEVNEAFAVVALHAIEELGLDPARTNPNGGALALGHPPGATGLRMTIAALNELERSGGRLGLVTMCLGGGQGMALLIERL